MNALSSAGGGGHGAALHHLAKGCESAVAEFLAPSSGPNKRKRRPAGTPDPGAEVVALSPKTLMESDRYVCEICNQGFQRDQNLQMHRRRHKVPWKLLKKTSSLGTNNKRVYICPERSCLHHDPTHALGDLVGIKKHFRRKHCTDKQWKCVKCSKRYAVQSDYKAHLKTCGTRGHCCDCGRVFSRVESFIEHQDTCSAVKRKTTQNSSLLHHHNADRLIFSSDSPSQSSDTTTQAISFPQSGLSAADTADNISMTKRMDVEHPRGRNQVHPEVPVLMSPAAMPSWLVTERRNELELLPSSSMQRVPGVPHLGVRTPGSSTDQASHGSISSASQVVPSISCPNAKSSTDLNQLCEEEMHTPCLRLSIGPASSSSTTEMVASCSSPHPSQHVDLRKPRFISAIGNETLALSSSHQRHEASIGVLTSRVDRTCSSHPAAIGKDLALSIPEPPNHTMEVPSNHAGSTLSDFLARAAWLKQMAKSKSKFYQSMEFRLQNNRESGFNEA